MELALGTVQFGLKYGIAGRGESVPPDEARAILVAAANRGIRTLDTAAAYGDIEERLQSLCGDLSFEIISKIPALPEDIKGKPAVDWVLASAAQSKKRLGPALRGLMFHNAEDLAGSQGDQIWQSLQAWAKNEDIKIGVSCYSPEEFTDLSGRFDISIAQLPGNAFDQRIQAIKPSKCKIFLRSVFLQGLLLLPSSVVNGRLPKAAHAVKKWEQWCRQKDIDPLQAALSIAKGFSPVSAVVVGVDNFDQLEGIAEAWERAQSLTATELQEADIDIIDPRRWKSLGK